MAINKVTKDGEILIDLSQDTVASAADIAAGKTGHLNDGTVVIGTHEGRKEEQTKTVTPTAAGLTVTPDSGKTLSSVTVNGDADLVAGNIKSGVEIFGVMGTHEGTKEEQTKTMTLGAAAPTTVTPDTGKVLSSVAPSIDGTVIKAANIAKGATILGVTGTHEGVKEEQTKTVTPTAAGLTVTPDSGKTLSAVTVNGDANLVAGNIKDGVTIFGVTGSLTSPQLHAPTISLSGDTLTITDDPDNGDFVYAFDVYDGNTKVATVYNVSLVTVTIAKTGGDGESIIYNGEYVDASDSPLSVPVGTVLTIGIFISNSGDEAAIYLDGTVVEGISSAGGSVSGSYDLTVSSNTSITITDSGYDGADIYILTNQ